MQDSGVPGNPREDVLKEEEKAEEVSKYEVEDYGGDEAGCCNFSYYYSSCILYKYCLSNFTNYVVYSPNAE